MPADLPDQHDDLLPADPHVRATMAARADRWWRDLPLGKRLAIIEGHTTPPKATGRGRGKRPTPPV